MEYKKQIILKKMKCHKCNKKKEPKNSPHNEITSSDGEYFFQAVRLSYNLKFTLPYALFGVSYVNTNYQQALVRYLPPGVSVTTSFDKLGNLLFTYTDGSVSDIIIIKTTPEYLISYGEILANLNTNYMYCNYMLLGVNNAATSPYLSTQDIYSLLSTPILFTNIDALTSVGGGKNQHIVIPKSRVIPNNSVPNLVEIYLRQEPIRANTVWLAQHFYSASISIAASTNPGHIGDGISNTYTLFIKDKINMNSTSENVFKETSNCNCQ